MRSFLESGKTSVPLPPRAPSTADGTTVDVEALRRAVRESDPKALAATDAPWEEVSHVSHAKRAYLSVLIDELGGDLPMIAKFWDRSAEKTIRKLVVDYGLTEELKAARARGPRAASSD